MSADQSILGVMLVLGMGLGFGSARASHTCPEPSGGWSWDETEKNMYERRIERLQQEASDAHRQCDMLDAVKMAQVQAEKQQVAFKKEREEEKASAAKKAAEINMLARSGQLTIEQLAKLLDGHNKDEIVTVMGPPDSKRMPQSSVSFGLESWAYKSKVKVEEGGPNLNLVIQFQSGRAKSVLTEK